MTDRWWAGSESAPNDSITTKSKRLFPEYFVSPFVTVNRSKETSEKSNQNIAHIIPNRLKLNKVSEKDVISLFIS